MQATCELPLRTLLAALAILVGFGSVGCTSLRGIPAHRIPHHLMGERRADRERIDLLRLRQDPPEVYLLAPRDILGVYVPGVLSGRDEGAPPTHFPENSRIPPAIGYPVAVREDGTISLPQVPAIRVEGLTITEAEIAVKRAYTKAKKIIADEEPQIIVTLMRPRAYQVLVIREDTTSQPLADISSTGRVNPSQNNYARAQILQRGSGMLVDLEAYQNDVLRALLVTGGLPGEDAKDEVVILRGGWSDAAERDRLLNGMFSSKDPCGFCRGRHRDRYSDHPSVLRIPLRMDGKRYVDFDQDSIILREGDIVMVENRNRDVFYTGGLLPGGAFLLPREEDTDVLKAIAIAGGAIGGGFGSGNRYGFGGGGLGALIPPSQIIVVRTVEGCGTFNIRVNLNRALVNPAERVIIQPGDIVILKYTTPEVLANVFLSTVNFNFLFNGLSGGQF